MLLLANETIPPLLEHRLAEDTFESSHDPTWLDDVLAARRTRSGLLVTQRKHEAKRDATPLADISLNGVLDDDLTCRSVRNVLPIEQGAPGSPNIRGALNATFLPTSNM
jgi:uncharacterized protein YbaR (Trm112 family)